MAHGREGQGRLSALLCLLAAWNCSAQGNSPVVEGEPPRVQALLEQGWAAESGQGGRGRFANPALAAALYRQAGELGSSEGYYRAALIHLPKQGETLPSGAAACLLTAASQLGHQRAAQLLDQASADATREGTACDQDPGPDNAALYSRFELERYLEALPLPKKRVVALIRKLAPAYSVDVRLALAVAGVESNFNTLALSPRMAMGVMQLIPATAARFNVREPFDPEQNIRGGLAYLRWLGWYFKGDVLRMVAAYNAGEGAVDLHKGVPPYRETQAYVVRVLGFAGNGARSLPNAAVADRP